MPRRTPDRQPGLALVPAAPRIITDADRAAAARRHEIGTSDDRLWLHWRAERAEYCIARYDRSARSSRYVGTGVGAGDGIDPPRQAIEALAAHFSARARPATPQAPAVVGLSNVLTRYLAEHVTHVHAPERPAYSVLAIEKFLADQRRRGLMEGVVTLDRLNLAFVGEFAAFRRRGGVKDSTIRRDLATLRAAVTWAAQNEMIGSVPFIPKLQGKSALKTRSRTLAYTLPQLAALLEATWASEHRRHAHLFIVTMLASHARTEAILECDLDLQYQDGVIDWLGPTREQTKKRRTLMPVGPTLAAWLDGREGKLIRYRVARPAARWADPEVPEFIERDTAQIKHAIDASLIAAGAAHPSLKLRTPVLDADGNQRVRLVKTARDGNGGWVEIEQPVWQGVGSPNTIRHTIHTQLSRIGVPKQQIDAAAGHVEQGTGAHYTHFDARRDFKEFTAGVEQLFDELREYTTCHLRTQCGPKIYDLGEFRTGRAG